VTRRPAIHQFVPSFAARDAIGHHALQLRALIRQLGFDSEIYAQDAHPEVRAVARSARSFLTGAAAERTWLLYHASTQSPLASGLLRRPEPLVIDYHNITPAESFAPWEPVIAAGQRQARRELRALAPAAVLGLADSAYNAAELDDLGCERTVVAPIIIDTDAFAGPVDDALADRLTLDGPAWLFVGRLAPNKAQHDLLRAFALYRRVYDPTARLWLVGGVSSDAYRRGLEQLVGRLGLGSSVHFAGSVSAAELAAYYRSASVFVCASDHEGFCVPLLEAMHHGLPIVAYASTAVPETLGDGGLCLVDKSPAVVAAAVARIDGDQALREAFVAAGRRRLADFDPRRTRQAFAAAFESLTAAA
jgi:L-malate glycosyltransferase